MNSITLSFLHRQSLSPDPARVRRRGPNAGYLPHRRWGNLSLPTGHHPAIRSLDRRLDRPPVQAQRRQVRRCVYRRQREVSKISQERLYVHVLRRVRLHQAVLQSRRSTSTYRIAEDDFVLLVAETVANVQANFIAVYN